MAKRALENSYELPNGNSYISAEDIKRAITDFSFLTANFMQIVNKERRMAPFKLNRAQRYIFDTLWPMLDPNTRLERHRQVVIVKGRQVGATVSVVAFVNYLCSFAQGIENMTILHSLPVTDTISKLAKRKVEPIITGIHPDIQPVINKDTLGSSIVYNYDNILGVKRRNVYELISASSSSIRSDTVNVWLADEAAWYRHPEELEDVIGGAMPDYGFSLSIFFSTYGERYNDFFLNKIKMARDNPQDVDLIFVPWFLSYPEVPLGSDIDMDELTDYERGTIIPALEEYKIPREEWPDKILWYRRKKLNVPHMKQEFPTNINEILMTRDDRKYFSEEAIAYQKENMNAGNFYNLMTDTISKEVRAVITDESDFKIIKQPIYGHKYVLMVDPINAQNEDTDYCAMVMFDMDTLEVAAVFHDKNMPTEDYADIAVTACKLYNRAYICPETNLCEAFMVCVRALGYYNIWYQDASARAKKVAGIRTTATSKKSMLDKFTLLLNRKQIRLYDPEIIDELEVFEKKTKRRTDGSITVTVAARKGKHDDLVMCCVLFAGILDDRQINGEKKSGFSII